MVQQGQAQAAQLSQEVQRLRSEVERLQTELNRERSGKDQQASRVTTLEQQLQEKTSSLVGGKLSVCRFVLLTRAASSWSKPTRLNTPVLLCSSIVAY